MKPHPLRPTSYVRNVLRPLNNVTKYTYIVSSKKRIALRLINAKLNGDKSHDDCLHLKNEIIYNIMLLSLCVRTQMKNKLYISEDFYSY